MNARGLIAETLRAMSELEWARSAKPGLLFDPFVPCPSVRLNSRPSASWSSPRLVIRLLLPAERVRHRVEIRVPFDHLSGASAERVVLRRSTREPLEGIGDALLLLHARVVEVRELGAGLRVRLLSNRSLARTARRLLGGARSGKRRRRENEAKDQSGASHRSSIGATMMPSRARVSPHTRGDERRVTTPIRGHRAPKNRPAHKHADGLRVERAIGPMSAGLS